MTAAWAGHVALGGCFSGSSASFQGVDVPRAARVALAPGEAAGGFHACRVALVAFERLVITLEADAEQTFSAFVGGARGC